MQRRGTTERAPGLDTESAGARHGKRRSPTKRAPGSDTKSAGARHREDTKSTGPRHREPPAPDTESAAARHRERKTSIQRAPGPDTGSAGAQYKERRASAGPDTNRSAFQQVVHSPSSRALSWLDGMARAGGRMSGMRLKVAPLGCPRWMVERLCPGP